MVTTTLPADIQAVFDRFITTEFTTLDRRRQPITWPVTPNYSPQAGCIDVTTGLGYPKKADDAAANPHVALLFSDPTGSGLELPPMVLVQGTADVDDRDLQANRIRYERESVQKLPATKAMAPPDFLKGWFSWYYTRIYVHVRPERVYVWPEGDIAREPQVLSSHMEEVRFGHSEEPEQAYGGPGRPGVWDERMEEFGARYASAVLSFVAPDGFPFAVRVHVAIDPAARLVRIEAEPVGAPLQPGLACLTAHDHAPDFAWQRNFQVRGDLVRHDDGWAVVPHRLLGGIELPPSPLERVRINLGKALRFRRIARREEARRTTGRASA